MQACKDKCFMQQRLPTAAKPQRCSEMLRGRSFFVHGFSNSLVPERRGIGRVGERRSIVPAVVGNASFHTHLISAADPHPMDARSRGHAYVGTIAMAPCGGDANDAFGNDCAERLEAPCQEDPPWKSI